MRKNLYKITGLILLMALLAACNTAKQEVEDVISPDDYPRVTFTTDFTGNTVTEGDTIIYTITLDKMLDKALTFEAILTTTDAEKAAGNVIDDHDFTAEEATIEPYSLETTLMIIIERDDMPELSETGQIEVGIDYIGEKYLVHPDTENPVLDLTFENYNNPDIITIAFGWDTDHDDIDCFVISQEFGDWGLAGTSANPEIMTDLWPSDPDGTYYFGIDPYYMEGTSTNYTISIGYPNQEPSVEFFTGTFSLAKLADYTADYFAYWDVMSYRVLEIELAAGVFTVDHVMPQ